MLLRSLGEFSVKSILSFLNTFLRASWSPNDYPFIFSSGTFLVSFNEVYLQAYNHCEDIKECFFKDNISQINVFEGSRMKACLSLHEFIIS